MPKPPRVGPSRAKLIVTSPFRFIKYAMRFTRGRGYSMFPSTGAGARYQREVGNGSSSSVVVAPLQWMMRTFPEAPLTVDRKSSDASANEWSQEDDHPMLELLERPNDYYSALLLWRATVSEFVLEGNAYWIKVRGDQHRVKEIWWAPSCLVEPKYPQDGSKFISYYEYRPGGEPVKLPVEDVVHFRWDLDPDDPRKGISPLRSVLREIFADDEAGRFSAALLANMGVPGLIVSPDNLDQVVPDDDLEATKQDIIEKTTGLKRGEPMVFGSATKVQQFGFSPQQMDMRTLRKVPEERVSGVLGVAAIVCGLGAGLDRSTFANYKEAREASYEQAMIPLQNILAGELKYQLLTEFESDVTKVRARFDLSEVRALQEDQNAIVERKLQELRAGAIMLSDYLRETGREATTEHNIYLRNFNIIMVREEDLGKPPAPLPNELAPGPAAGALPKPGQGQDADHPLHLPPGVDPTTGKKLGWLKSGDNGHTQWVWGVLPVEVLPNGEED